MLQGGLAQTRLRESGKLACVVWAKPKGNRVGRDEIRGDLECCMEVWARQDCVEAENLRARSGPNLKEIV